MAQRELAKPASGPSSGTTLSKLRERWDALDAETKAQREAEARAKLAATLKRLEQQLGPIRANLEMLPPDDRKRFVWGHVDDTPVHHLVERRSAIYRAASAARPTLNSALLTRARARARESRPESRRGRSATATRAGPSDESDLADLSPPQAGYLTFLRGLLTATEGGFRTYVALLDLIATRVAYETAQVTEWGSGER